MVDGTSIQRDGAARHQWKMVDGTSILGDGAARTTSGRWGDGNFYLRRWYCATPVEDGRWYFCSERDGYCATPQWKMVDGTSVFK
ncbi:hypothetical protein RRG08_000072 [Elysia crispata]|uniref:Uncharacterized protein n=1 Tax=Elysia crispata TaxID=231223 RepID=A0AAE1DTE3_9GAST|nr:hypothetical protein RRG08_000072 [Elysia crispata]